MFSGRRLLLSLCLGCSGVSPSPDAVVRDSAAQSSPSSPPNQLIILADDLGVDKLDLYDVPVSGERALTPVIDALASEGVVFDRGYAAPTCSPSRAALLTGDYPRKSGVSRALKVGGGSSLNPDLTLLPRVLSEQAGYRTAWFGKWHLASRPRECEHPIDVGFDTYEGSIFNFTESGSLVAAPTYEKWEKCIDGVPERVEIYATEDTVVDTLEAIETLPEPWLIVVSFNAPHEPFHRPPEGWHRREEFDGGKHTLFLAAIESVDIGTGMILEALGEDLSSRTNVWFLGDNGTPDKMLRLPPKQGKGSLRESGVRVPFMARGPSISEPGRRDAAFVHLVDLFPTVLSQAGIEVPQGIAGRDLSPLLAGEDGAETRDALLWEVFHPDGDLTGRISWDRSYTDGDFKLIERQVWGMPRRIEFFELEVDDGWDVRDLLRGPGLNEVQQEAFDRMLEELEQQLPVNIVEVPVPT